jgi:hypothetical protein
MRTARRNKVAYTVALFAFYTTACGGDRWAGFVYPDRNNLAVHRELGEFKTLEACRDASRLYLADIGSQATGDYECGKNCRPSTTFPGMNTCDDTLR